jgi:hypothetical protein
VTKILACGSTLTTSPGAITSTNYPNIYPASTTCTWLLSAGSGKLVNFTFTNMDVEYKLDNDCTSDCNTNCVYDSVSLFDGQTEVGNEVPNCHRKILSLEVIEGLILKILSD